MPILISIADCPRCGAMLPLNIENATADSSQFKLQESFSSQDEAIKFLRASDNPKLIGVKKIGGYWYEWLEDESRDYSGFLLVGGKSGIVVPVWGTGVQGDARLDGYREAKREAAEIIRKLEVKLNATVEARDAARRLGYNEARRDASIKIGILTLKLQQLQEELQKLKTEIFEVWVTQGQGSSIVAKFSTLEAALGMVQDHEGEASFGIKLPNGEWYSWDGVEANPRKKK